MMGEMDAATAAKVMYGPLLSPGTMRRVEAMKESDQTYLWTYIYHQMPLQLMRDELMEREQAVSYLVERYGRDEELSATPFSDAEDSVSAHSFFTAKSVIRRPF